MVVEVVVLASSFSTSAQSRTRPTVAHKAEASANPATTAHHQPIPSAHHVRKTRLATPPPPRADARRRRLGAVRADVGAHGGGAGPAGRHADPGARTPVCQRDVRHLV